MTGPAPAAVRHEPAALRPDTPMLLTPVYRWLIFLGAVTGAVSLVLNINGTLNRGGPAPATIPAGPATTGCAAPQRGTVRDTTPVLAARPPRPDGSASAPRPADAALDCRVSLL